jgi:hypothetical protein
MSAFLGAVLLVGGAIALFKLFGLFPIALQAVQTSRNAFTVMHDPRLGDDRKEALLQGYSLELLRRFLDLLIRGAGSIALPVGLLWMFDVVGLLSLNAVWALTLSWPFLLGSVTAAMVTFWALEKRHGL